MAVYLFYSVDILVLTSEDRVQTLVQDLNKISKHFISIGNIFSFLSIKKIILKFDYTSRY